MNGGGGGGACTRTKSSERMSEVMFFVSTNHAANNGLHPNSCVMKSTWNSFDFPNRTITGAFSTSIRIFPLSRELQYGLQNMLKSHPGHRCHSSRSCPLHRMNSKTSIPIEWRLPTLDGTCDRLNKFWIMVDKPSKVSCIYDPFTRY